MRPSAVVVLGWGVLRALARRASRRDRPSGAADRYLADRIVPLGPDDRAAIAGASRCIACGRCDEVAAESPAGRLPSDWVLARLRDLTDRDVADAPPAAPGVMDEMERACPTGVPFGRF